MVTVVYVDDETVICDEVRDALSYLPCNAHVFDDSHDCWEFLEKCDGKVDVLIADLTMPKLNGAELIQLCLARFGGSIKYVLVSGRMETGESIRRILPNLDRVMSKPIKTAEFAKIVEVAS